MEQKENYIQTNSHPYQPPWKNMISRRRIQTQIKLVHELQGDTGANCSATNRQDILWYYKPLRQPIPIETYNQTDTETQCKAVGTGMIRMIDNNHNIIEWITLYIPKSTGTILSPDKYVMDNKHIQTFTHEGNRNGNGRIYFCDQRQNKINEINMKRRKDGLWFSDNSIMIPIERRKPQTITEMIHQIPIKHKINRTITTQCHPTNYAFEPTIHNIQQQQQQQKATDALKQLEVWHQRLGHPSQHTLRETQKVVHGIPVLPSTPPIFKCPFCEDAKTTHRHGGPNNPHECFIPGTAYHMDLGFINWTQPQKRGDNTTKQQQNKSYDGYIAYLLIIDAASRYTWIFLLKNKQPPIDIINKFLNKYGLANRTKEIRKITTNPDNVLAKSKRFKQLCQEQGYDMTTQHHQMDSGMYNLNELSYTIRTDNGGELAGSTKFRDMIDQHGYTLETTAAGSSFQNAIAERPHRTLKEKVRCLLYTAGLGMEYWSSALIHAVWLYNRMYHKSIETTPYQAFTGKQPILDKLITWGCKVKSSNKRPMTRALDKRTTTGIFLGYTTSMKNIYYLDTTTMQKRKATIDCIDEAQYGDEPTQRSPGAQHLIQVYTGTPNHTRGNHQMHEQPIEMKNEQTQPVGDINKDTIDISPSSYVQVVAKAQNTRININDLINELRTVQITTNPYEQAVCETIPIQGIHQTLGLDIVDHPEYNDMVMFRRCIPGTIAHKNIRRWKSRLTGAIITAIDDIEITSRRQLIQTIRKYRQQGKQSAKIEFARPNNTNHTGDGIPIMHFDQLHVVAQHIHQIRTGEDVNMDTIEWPEISHESLSIAKKKGMNIPKLTRRKIMESEDAAAFKKSEWKQLNRYHGQGMFGEPCPDPRQSGINATVLDWVWSYLYKVDPVTLEETPKARATCNGNKKKITTLAETYAACVDQPAHRLMWALVAALNYVAIGVDVANAYAEAPGTKEMFYMKVDHQFQEWWTTELKRDPIPHGWVIPIKKNLQGHPEGPRLWNKYIDNILNDLKFQRTTHEGCLYYQHHAKHGLILILRQVDDFIIAAKDEDIARNVRNDIQKHMSNPMNELGIIKRFSGSDIHQTRHYVKISSETYIQKICEHHKWTNENVANVPIPMRSDSKYQATLETTKGPSEPQEQQKLEEQMGFSYRQAIGELIYAMTTNRIDISAATIKLSQYSNQPAKCHYQAVKQIFVYLYATKEYGIYYWRPQPNNSLPEEEIPTTITDLTKLQVYHEQDNPTTVHGSSDATWATDRSHRRSTGGIAFLLAGGTIYYRTRIPAGVAQSSTEAEFCMMVDAGKAALYLRSILEEIRIPQIQPTVILCDNRGARHMANSQKPTKRTRHVDMKQFVILEWTEEEQIVFKDVPTSINPSDSLSKQTGRIKFHEHMDILMGRKCPTYAQSNNKNRNKTTKAPTAPALEKPYISYMSIHKKPQPYQIVLSTYSNLLIREDV